MNSIQNKTEDQKDFKPFLIFESEKWLKDDAGKWINFSTIVDKNRGYDVSHQSVPQLYD